MNKTNNSNNPRLLAVLAVERIETSEDFIAEILDSFIRRNKLSDLNNRLFTELVYGTVRMRDNLDYVLGLFSRRPLVKIQRRVLNILRIGAYQILYMDKIPVSASVNEAVKLARIFGHQGIAGFINGILRNLVRNRAKITYPDFVTDPIKHIATCYSYPEWMVKMWVDMWGASEAREFCIACNQKPSITIRVNTRQVSTTELTSYFEELGGLVTAGQYAPDVLQITPGQLAIQDQLLKEGAYYIQDESSTLVAHAVNPKSGERIYDLCSAPGGKTTHIAQLMDNEGEVIAFDKNATRLEKVAENAVRQKLTIIESKVADGTVDLNLAPADRVVVDAPCSGLGTISHRPDIRWRKHPSEIDELAKIQKQILQNAAHYVKVGGLLVYSTCTVTAAENQNVVSWFLAQHPNFSGYPLPDWFPKNERDTDYYRQFTPHRHQIDGFFIATLIKEK